MNANTIELSHRSAPDRPATRPSNIAMALAVRHVQFDRRASIAAMAYEMAARRGFAPGRELDDWLAAENEVDARFLGEACAF